MRYGLFAVVITTATIAATATIARTGAVGAAKASITTAITAAAVAITATTTIAATAITVAAAAAAVTAAAATTVAAFAVAAAIATTTAVATFMVATAKAAGARRAGLHRTSLIDHQAATAQRLAIHALNGGLCFCVAAHFHKAEAFGAAGVAFHHDASTCDSSELAERLLQVVVAHTIWKVADIQLIAH